MSEYLIQKSTCDAIAEGYRNIRFSEITTGQSTTGPVSLSTISDFLKSMPIKCAMVDSRNIADGVITSGYLNVGSSGLNINDPCYFIARFYPNESQSSGTGWGYAICITKNTSIIYCQHFNSAGVELDTQYANVSFYNNNTRMTLIWHVAESGADPIYFSGHYKLWVIQ